MRLGTVTNWDEAKVFLNEAAKYFANRPTDGEDSAYWANVYNSENCKKIVELIEKDHK